MWLHHLDRIGMDDPDNNEGFPEDICTVCERRIVDHPGHEMYGLGNGSARWPHRRAALARLILGQL
ncbi:hypothetical protein ORI20_14150 [Mycobacterium sp. CVI_P3]|uniref:Uncharacterized protein n=1 Tax=Mycobacterium pinniadriaticum TaxID=2994102 RepID=A0ABT3SEA8_9MYCO|nr:hypothetical protein [Mycobacterium pinniadriaticum]MCX2931423.1 hypothetical protein [Mycobacterium pinniadriaticum]MCX2937847.1 hypothetical protein [Mycobacterium pinniadriaticum]